MCVEGGWVCACGGCVCVCVHARARACVCVCVCVCACATLAALLQLGLCWDMYTRACVRYHICAHKCVYVCFQVRFPQIIALINSAQIN